MLVDREKKRKDLLLAWTSTSREPLPWEESSGEVSSIFNGIVFPSVFSNVRKSVGVVEVSGAGRTNGLSCRTRLIGERSKIALHDEESAKFFDRKIEKRTVSYVYGQFPSRDPPYPARPRLPIVQADQERSKSVSRSRESSSKRRTSRPETLNDVVTGKRDSDLEVSSSETTRAISAMKRIEMESSHQNLFHDSEKKGFRQRCVRGTKSANLRSIPPRYPMPCEFANVSFVNEILRYPPSVSTTKS